MLTGLRIQNYRCFDELAIAPLGRVNLLGGKNNVGKTALLEAILLLQTPVAPSAINVLQQTRSLGGTLADPWTWLLLFPEGRAQSPIHLQADSPAGAEDLTIGFSSPEWMILSGESATGARPAFSVELTYQGSRGRGTSRVEVDAGEAHVARAPIAVAPPTRYYPASRRPNPDDENRRFTQIELEGRQEELLAVLRLLEPRLRRLQLLSISGETILFGDLGLKQPLPVRLMGDGFGRLLALLLGILTAPGAIVLIDEIENGVHYTNLVDVWTALGEAARRADVQLFATTHSWECIVAAQRAFHDAGGETFRFHRIERADTAIRAFTYDPDAFVAAVDMGMEVR